MELSRSNTAGAITILSALPIVHSAQKSDSAGVFNAVARLLHVLVQKSENLFLGNVFSSSLERATMA